MEEEDNYVVMMGYCFSVNAKNHEKDVTEEFV